MIDDRAVEAAARAIARARGVNPDMCIEGSGSVAYRGDASFKCTKYAWQQFIGDVHAAAPFLTQIPDGWKTIDTAPKDGTQVLVAQWHRGSRNHSYRVAHWNGENWQAVLSVLPTHAVTHWQPLPLPPPTEKNNG